MARGNERGKIFFLKKDYEKFKNASNKEIGELLGGMSYSAVTKAFQRFRKELREDGGLQIEMERLKKKLPAFKTLFFSRLPSGFLQTSPHGEALAFGKYFW